MCDQIESAGWRGVSQPHVVFSLVGYAPTFARNHAEPPFGRRFWPWSSRVITPVEPVRLRLQSPPTLGITTAKEGARWPLLTRGLAVY